MIEISIPGTPVPIVDPNSPFPFEPAEVLISNARKVGDTTVESMIEMIKGMFGQPDQVRRVLDAWTAASRHLTASTDGHNDRPAVPGGTVGLLAANDQLNAYWQSNGATAASAYVLRIVDTTKTVNTSIVKVAQEINKLHGKVMDLYLQAIDRISFYGATMTRLTGSTAAAALSLDLGGVVGAIFETIAKFLEDSHKIIKEGMKYCEEIRHIISEIKISAAQIPVVGSIAGVALDRDGWVPKQQPR
ncbi:hypothetical protein ACWIGW_31790 [Nocardia brasiliensis]